MVPAPRGAQPPTPLGRKRPAQDASHPGHGLARWGEIFNVLKNSGYRGAVSVELEDENFNGSEDGEKRALEMSIAYLKSI